MPFFVSNNNSEANVETWTYETYADSGYTTGVFVGFHQEGGGSGRRGNWVVDGVLNAGSVPDFAFTDDSSAQTGTPKTITLRTNKLRDLKQISGTNQRLIHLDLSSWDRLTTINCGENVTNAMQRFTGITFSDVMEDKIVTFRLAGASPSQGTRIKYWDLSSFKNMGGYFGPNRTNPSLVETIFVWPTGHTGNGWNGNGTNTNDRFNLEANYMTGNLDLSWLPNNGFNVSTFDISSNGFSAFTFPPTNNFCARSAWFDIDFSSSMDNTSTTGLYMDLSPLSGTNADSDLIISNNTTLTGISWLGNMTSISEIQMDNTALANEFIDFDNLGIEIYQNVGMSSMLSATTCTFKDQTTSSTGSIAMQDSNWTGTINLTGMTNTRNLSIYNNPNLTNILLPASIITWVNNGSTGGPWSNEVAFGAYGCDLGYIDFTVMSGATFDSSDTIYLYDNNMTAAEVNHILVDFDTIGWSGVTLDISGTNAAPDGTSGGFDGLTARNNLTGKTWTVTTS
jgi:hypothetical protein